MKMYAVVSPNTILEFFLSISYHLYHVSWDGFRLNLQTLAKHIFLIKNESDLIDSLFELVLKQSGYF